MRGIWQLVQDDAYSNMIEKAFAGVIENMPPIEERRRQDVRCSHCKSIIGDPKWSWGEEVCNGCIINTQIKRWWTQHGKPHPVLQPELMECSKCGSIRHESNMHVSKIKKNRHSAYVCGKYQWADEFECICHECEWNNELIRLARQSLKLSKINPDEYPEMVELQKKIYETKKRLSKNSDYKYLTNPQINIYDYTSEQLQRNAPGSKRESKWIANWKKKTADSKGSE